MKSDELSDSFLLIPKKSDKETISSSITNNFIFNTITMFTIGFFPFFTIPYITRVIGPAGYGKIAFISTIVNYFVLIASLGIQIYGIREISRYRNEKRKLNQRFTSLFLLNFLSTVIVSLFYIFLVLTFDKFIPDQIIFLAVGFQLFSNIFMLAGCFRD